jgi:hypothetical protein
MQMIDPPWGSIGIGIAFQVSERACGTANKAAENTYSKSSPFLQLKELQYI